MPKSQRESEPKDQNLELDRLRKENAKLKELLSDFSEIIYLAIQSGEASLSTRVKICVNPNSRHKFFKDGWRVYQVNLTQETIERVYPEKPIDISPEK